MAMMFSCDLKMSAVKDTQHKDLGELLYRKLLSASPPGFAPVARLWKHEQCDRSNHGNATGEKTT